MRRTWVMIAALAVVCALTTTWTVVGQTARGGGPAAKDAAAEAEPQYIPVLRDQLASRPAEFENQYVQVADIFGTIVTRYPAVLVQYGISPQTHFAFRTHRALGSNMLCFAPRSNKEAQAFFDTPLVSETPIYLMGRVGPRIDTDDGLSTIFIVDRIARGNTPPPTEVKKKAVRMTIEWQTPAGPQRQEYLIPEPNKRYVIPDPYDKTKSFHISLQY